MGMILYYVPEGPPSLAVMMALKHFQIDYKLVEVDFPKGEHLKEEYEKMNPQKEIPTLDDNGFFLSESTAILQYLAEQYKKDDPIYPNEAKKRAIVNHRLAFNVASYYARIVDYAVGPIFFDYERAPGGLKKLNYVLAQFDTILERQNTKFSAGDNLTIADFALVAATLCLEAIDFSLAEYKHITKWYNTFKQEFPELWTIAEGGMKELNKYNSNIPLFPLLDHPIHPVRK
ncbi:glutathione S-transferase 1-like [Homalodisca vitripennis]|uniref:Uncharacterized protein n=1 Tax=Homalodisca liturata TaxID=320908 RepID=A0A1B6K3F4_9HEMI|nr:glutathione S-transferase 1-like [Homalodisca vitripennis]KAG8299051.1 hypothetical protein J6590_003019 [Homalodisca vitripennis]